MKMGISPAWKIPFQLCGLLLLNVHFRQDCAYQRFSERRRHGVSAAGYVLILRVLYTAVVLVDDVPLRETLGAVEFCRLPIDEKKASEEALAVDMGIPISLDMACLLPDGTKFLLKMGIETISYFCKIIRRAYGRYSNYNSLSAAWNYIITIKIFARQ